VYRSPRLRGTLVPKVQLRRSRMCSSKSPALAQTSTGSLASSARSREAADETRVPNGRAVLERPAHNLRAR
jgi:hypothetical protein